MQVVLGKCACGCVLCVCGATTRRDNATYAIVCRLFAFKTYACTQKHAPHIYIYSPIGLCKYYVSTRVRVCVFVHYKYYIVDFGILIDDKLLCV